MLFRSGTASEHRTSRGITGTERIEWIWDQSWLLPLQPLYSPTGRQRLFRNTHTPSFSFTHKHTHRHTTYLMVCRLALAKTTHLLLINMRVCVLRGPPNVVCVRNPSPLELSLAALPVRLSRRKRRQRGTERLPFIPQSAKPSTQPPSAHSICHIN